MSKFQVLILGLTMKYLTYFKHSMNLQVQFQKKINRFNKNLKSFDFTS